MTERRVDERGQGLVEFAVILPLLAMITFGVLDLGRLYVAYTTVANAAHQAAVCVSHGTALCPGGANGAATAEVDGTLPGGVTTSVTGAGGGSGGTVTVTVTHSFQPLTTAVIGGGAFPVRATAAAVIP
jgi:Flp pilus assembly protein TadG